MNIDTLTSFTKRKDYMGRGYLSHPDRSSQSDQDLLDAAEAESVSKDDLFLWCNSSYGRYTMDRYSEDGRKVFNKLYHQIELLKKEIQDENKDKMPMDVDEDDKEMVCIDCGSHNIGMNKKDEDDWICLSCDSKNLGYR